VSDRLLRLPFYNDLTEQEQAHVIEVMRVRRLAGT
jgi:dTDP-4-amino-4,6-dideoxygalactose transaminase